MELNKKKAAALSAVLYYLHSEEEQAAAQISLQVRPPQEAPPALPPAPAFRPWGPSGRQTQMQLRGLMQLKAFHR